MAVNNESEIITFADKYLSPYKIREKPLGREIVPELCPFCHGGEHGDKNTFALSIDKGCYVCMRGSCRAHGTLPMLAEKFGTAMAAVKHSSSNSGQGKDFSLPKVEILPATDEIYRYFDRRKISRETVDAFKVGADSKGNIVFPFFEGGINVFVKFRPPYKPNPQEAKRPKEWREPNTKAVLFHMDDCVFSEPLYITEGLIDAMSLYEAGISNVVSVPSGCEDTTWIENCYDWLERFKTIVLFGDNDAPGQKMVHEVSRRLDESRCKIVSNYPTRPDGKVCKDANEILYFYGALEVIAAAETAEEIPSKGVINLAKVSPVDTTAIPRIKTMIPALDDCIGGLAPGEITIMTGKTGHGKSTLAGLILLNAIEQGKSVCAYSGELNKERFQNWIHFQAAGSDYIGLKFDPVKGKEVPFVPWEVHQRIRQWYDGKFFLYDNKEFFDTSQADAIINVFTGVARRYGCSLFLIDNMMTSVSDSEEEFRAQGKFINAVKRFAERFNVHVILIAHPRKTKAGEQLRGDDIAGNSQILNLADNGISSERPNLRVLKNREEGVLKVIECAYCADSRRIYQVDAGDNNEFSWDKTGIEKPAVLACSRPEYGVKYAETTMPF